MTNDDDEDRWPDPPEIASFPSLPGIGLHTPLSLPKAARIAFPDGSISASVLRSMADRGLLAIEKLGRTRLTTLADINDMRALCRHPANPLGSSSVAAQVVRPSTSSSTTDLKSARAAALIASERRRKRSRGT